MSLKRNILASYVSRLYVTLIAIVMVPVYVRYMGTEAFGLVGFFAVLQVWFQLLDMGLTPSMAREVARFRGGATDALSLRRLLRALEGIFVAVSMLGAAAMIVGAGAIASSWLKVQQLPLEEVKHAIMLMALIVVLRWVCGLYSGAISGFERLVWLGGFNMVIATARFVLVIPFFIYVGASPSTFFSYQFAIALIEITVLVAQTYRLLPKVHEGQRSPWHWQPLRGVLKFSLSIAFTGAVGILVTQTDKLVLSTLLPLKDYAYFTLAVLVASGVVVITSPISVALLPRLSRLNAASDDAGVIRLYRNATQLVSMIAIPTALVLAFFAEQVLWAWIGDADFALKAAPVLRLYALGNGFFALAAFPYYLQFAKGDLKLHVIGNLLFAAIFIPLLLWAVREYGMIGAGYAWIVANVLPFVFWLPIVHRRFSKGLHTRWLLHDVMPILVFPTAATFLVHEYAAWPTTQLMVAIGVVVVWMALCAVAVSCSSWARETLGSRWLVRLL